MKNYVIAAMVIFLGFGIIWQRNTYLNLAIKCLFIGLGLYGFYLVTR